MKWINFNINTTVRVKLTDHGREIYCSNHNELIQKCLDSGYPAHVAYEPIKEDSQGWSEWQLWQLMATFGKHIDVCENNPFDTIIKIPQSKS